MRLLRFEKQGVRLRSLAAYLGPRVVSNADLVAMGVPLTEAEIEKLSGIVTRRWANPEQAASELAIEACRAALSATNVSSKEVQRLVLGTVSPDHPSPATACAVQAKLELFDATAFDVSAACAGFGFALENAARAVLTGDSCVIAAAADVRSRYVDLSDRATCALFGDGAVAAVLGPAPVGEGLLAIGTAADGRGFHSLYVPVGGSREPATIENVTERRHKLRMADGPAIYLQAVEGMVELASNALTTLGLTIDDIALIVPHQPNKRLLDRMVRLSGWPAEKLYVHVQKIGNLSGASSGVALTHALLEGRVRAGQKVLLVTAGAGYTAAVALLQVDDALLSSVTVA